MLILPCSAISGSIEYGPFVFEKYYYYIFWIPCECAGDKGIAVKVVYPKTPRYENAAPVAVFVAGGTKEGFLGFYEPNWDPHGVVWLTFIFPGGEQQVMLPNGETLEVESGGEYDYRGDVCFEALNCVIRFAKGEISNTVGKKIGDYASYEVLSDDVGIYGSSYGGITAALTLAKYGRIVDYLIFYESPPHNMLITTDLGKIGDDEDTVDADGDGLYWNDLRNPNYILNSCNETGCVIDFSTLAYDPTLGFYLDNNGDGKPNYIGVHPMASTDVDGSGFIESDEDFIFMAWEVTLNGTTKKVYSIPVIEAATNKGLNFSSEIMNASETYDFWYIRDLSYHYDELPKDVKFMQLGFLKEHMCPAPDFPNIVVNYNALKNRGFWIRLNPDSSYLEYVTGREIEEENDANIEINFGNVREHLIHDESLNFDERKLIELASVLEMADRTYYNDWSSNLDTVLTNCTSNLQWTSIGPDGGDNYFIFVTSNHTVITSTANSAFRSEDGTNWERIDSGLIDVGFVSMAEINGTIFAGVAKGKGIMISRDDGKTWSMIDTGIYEIESGRSGAKNVICEVVSIVPLNESHIYFATKVLKPSVYTFNGVYELLSTSSGWKVISHQIPGSEYNIHQMVVFRLAYDPDFNGEPTLFVSKYPEGLYIVTNLSGEWEWEKVFDAKTTDVTVATDADIVYVGTYDDWIYRGEITPSGWNWIKLNPFDFSSLVEPPIPCVISEVEVDPYNHDRVWWGSPGSLVRIYSLPEGHENYFGVFAWNGTWLHSFITPGWGAFIAIDRGDEEEYATYIGSVKGAKIAYTCSYSFKCVLRTVDGGMTWKSSYNKLHGDCINEVSFLNDGELSNTLVVMCVSGIELSYDCGNSWDDEFDVTPSGARLGFPWWALPVDNYTVEINGKTYEADFLLITGYPGPESGVKRFGLFAVSVDYIKDAKNSGLPIEDGFVQLTSNPAVYGIKDGYTVVLALQEGGIEIYDLETGTSQIVPVADDAGVYKIVKTTIDGMNWWIVSTYEGEEIFKDSFGNDHYFWYGPSRIFATTDFSSWTQIYPESGKTDMGIVSLNVNGAELLALESSGKIIYSDDFREGNWRIFEISEENVWFYTDMEVDWDKGLAFISTAGDGGNGVCYVSLSKIRSGVNVECEPFNENLPTRLVRNLLLADEYLFAGTWWASVWRVSTSGQSYNMSSLLLQPQATTLIRNLTTTIDVILDYVSSGLNYTNISITITEPIAEITNIQLPSWAVLADNSSLPASTVWFKVGDLNDQVKAGDTNVVLATLTVKGLETGSTDILMTVNSFQDDNYQNIEDKIATISGTITVIAGPPPIDDHQPMDLNGDGLFEDVNGDGQFNFGDIVALFQNFESWHNAGYDAFYDFNGDGQLTFGDIVALFQMLE